jgi:hypothetical protein
MTILSSPLMRYSPRRPDPLPLVEYLAAGPSSANSAIASGLKNYINNALSKTKLIADESDDQITQGMISPFMPQAISDV